MINSNPVQQPNRTTFGKSFWHLTWTVCTPLISYYLCTSPEIRTQPPWSQPLAIGVSWAVFAGSMLLNQIGYWLRWYQSDQLIFSTASACCIMSFYISGWLLPSTSTVTWMIRVVIALSSIIAGCFCGTVWKLLNHKSRSSV